MDFAESERVRTIRSIAREFVQKELVPLEPALRRRRFVELLPELRRVRDRAKETGLWAAHLPAEWGGAGLGLVEFAHLSEELGRTPIGHYAFNVQAPDVGNMEILLEHGT
ncbi:MAG TPA: acyl-CoA dehydrogenase family protein, partial [Anaeromyxobacter sp.]|nr:acyl-CoA dehydrogenase family protein [Anaeromyxobacter sp.]